MDYKIKDKPLKRFIVCGGRDFKDWKLLQEKMEIVLKEEFMFIVAHGGATGADSLAGAWADFHSLVVEVYPAEWKKYGRQAGPLRNQLMIDSGPVDGVIAFPGGNGTADMVRRATEQGIPVWDLRNATV